jgi:L-lactate utilization protein LutC
METTSQGTQNMEKEAFFSRVRQALGRDIPLAHTPDHPALKTALPRQQEKVRTVLAKVEARRLSLLPQLAERAAGAGWHVHRVASYNEAALMVGEIARKLNARRIVRSSEEIFRRTEVDMALRSVRVAPIVLASGRQRRRSDLQPLAWKAELGIVGVDYAIAETGSCVVTPRRGVARMTSLAPPALIALVEAEQVLESLDDLLALRRLEYVRSRGRTPLSMTIISGPSRTADIEFTLTTGVHGPGEVYMVLIG